LASRMKDPTPLVTKQMWLAQLNALVRYYAKYNNQKWLNETVEVLVEGKSKTNKTMWTGYSPQWKVVNFTGNNIKIGKTVKVKITQTLGFSLLGKTQAEEINIF
jgi:tRNA-2-methylthio-N6-dimethylallyladenosine synthase